MPFKANYKLGPITNYQNLNYLGEIYMAATSKSSWSFGTRALMLLFFKPPTAIIAMEMSSKSNNLHPLLGLKIRMVLVNSRLKRIWKVPLLKANGRQIKP